MHSSSQFVLHPPERCSQPVTAGLPMEQEAPAARSTAEEREAQKGEGCRPAKTLPLLFKFAKVGVSHHIGTGGRRLA